MAILQRRLEYVPVPEGPYVVPHSGAEGEIDLSLVLPTYKEARNIRPMLNLVLETLREVEGLRFEVIVVDDNSPDGTAELALEESAKHPEVRVILRVEEIGLSTAVVRGWQAAGGEILAVIDAELQHPPEVLAGLLKGIRNGADLPLARRAAEQRGVCVCGLVPRPISRTA